MPERAKRTSHNAGKFASDKHSHPNTSSNEAGAGG